MRYIYNSLNNKGFTLIEVIIIFVMVSLAGLMTLTLMENEIAHSGDPLITLNDNIAVVRSIEIINADYRNRLNTNPNQDMGIYVGDLSGSINGLAGTGVQGQYIRFGNPDANRKVVEVNSGGPSTYVKVIARRNNSRVITLLGN